MKQYESEASHQDWVINKLGCDRMERLKGVSLKKIVEIDNKKLLMIH